MSPGEVMTKEQSTSQTMNLAIKENGIYYVLLKTQQRITTKKHVVYR